MSRSENARTRWPLLLLLSAVFVIGVVSMPREEYSSDPAAIRCETVSLINNGSLDVPADIAERFGGVRGQFFFQNGADGKYYSKYGILNSLLYVPALLAQKWHDGSLTYHSDGRAIYLNWFNLVLAIASAWYLYLIACRYTTLRSVAVIFVLTAFYCTFWWNYLRGQCSEIYQTLFMLGCYHHLVSFFRNSAVALRRGDRGSGRLNLVLAGAYLGALILVKIVYMALIPVVLLAILGVELSRRRWKPGPVRSWFDLLCPAFWIGLPIACALCVLLGANAWKFGSPWETGYSQWKQFGKPLFAGSITAGLHGFLFERGHSILIYFPLFTFALFGYREFFRKYRADTVLFASTGVIMLLLCSHLAEWAGGWAYGPRYMLPFLPLLSLPFLSTLEFLMNNWRKWWVAGCAVVVAGALFCSFEFQMKVNAMPFFAYYKLLGLFVSLQIPEVDEYFAHHSLGEVDADLLAYKKGKPWRVFEAVAPTLNAKGVEKVRELLRVYTASNYYFWPDAPEPAGR